jgi:predicted ATP-dependent endonuclease of OLD family
MKLISYESGTGSGKTDLHFSRLTFSKLNLIVGASATGKTKLLNTIFNGGMMAARSDVFYHGWWSYVFEHRNKTYEWTIDTTANEEGETKIRSEKILLRDDSSEKILVQRDDNSFLFNGRELPKLLSNQSSIQLLKDEELIKPINEAFSSIMRRSFQRSELDEVSGIQAIPKRLIDQMKKQRNLDELFQAGNLLLNARLYLLLNFFQPLYERICDEFKNVFPFVSEIAVLNADAFGIEFQGIVPIFAIREKYIKDKWIPLNEFSSGMQKVLLILTDIFTLPQYGGVYLIDEYENSLGVNAINFFPGVILEAVSESQFIITSHHPYIISNVPVKDWIILHRRGNEVLAKEGRALEEKYGKSKQSSFVQLINDPFYTEGIE